MRTSTEKMPSPKPKPSPNGGSGSDVKYFKLWRRFYEPLVMLKILGSTRGEHSPKTQQQSPVHRFLDNLAYLVDHDKGGPTTSAIGLEDAPQRFNFWIASNEPKQSLKSAAFLTSFLRDVRAVADEPIGKRASLQEKVTHRCIDFAKQRVKKEAKMLAKDVSKCTRYLTSPECIELSQWLKRFQETEPPESCYLAYRERDSLMMRQLSRLLQASSDISATDSQTVAMKDVVHRLGRLAHHVRAPHQIIEDVSNHTGLRNVLDEFQVHSIAAQAVIDRPQAESSIDIDSIMRRMLPSNGFDARHKEAAHTMNRLHHIVTRFKEAYNNKNFSPSIHAEIQILEHFWGKRQFFEDDRYIGCSKPACYCCHLYMQHHPARCAVPQTSCNVYLNWGLRKLPKGSHDAEYTRQRDILNEMTKSIRKDALDQILRKTTASPWHPDSQTGFTLRAPSEAGGQAEAMRMVDLDLATDSDDSQPESIGCYASGSRHSSVASMSDDSKRSGRRKLSWPVIEDSDSDSDSSSGGAVL
ncbi:hypothetical protein F5B22DRAFT_562790 [Xylaria bambusicola]|uniref:uncharacterized protein n=1 Tax=Xylaria bambusicola TaxID=326684 RepID=UPI00200741A0|nr:uncharacterized protein F5B22DRAFT_562790 [Xylaria bambusicola]KAI0503146.1 hypothetical protein F5B22DRAFT_562790 [Xylaria bambusicola]